MKSIPIESAVGQPLAHDITEIRPGEFKGPAFRKGHTVCDDDLCHLRRLGKNNLYVLDMGDDEIHENEAAALLAGAIAGDGVVWENDPREGKIEMTAARDGLLFVDTAALAALNMVPEVMCATLHTHTRVVAGEVVAATRAIPLVMPRAPVERAAALAGQNGAVVSVAPLAPAKAGAVITGNEVFNGLIKDRYAPILAEKMTGLGGAVTRTAMAPDNADEIAARIVEHRDAGCDLIIVTGGMSVDPDDVTRKGIRQAGVTEWHYGAAVLPGAMFLVAYLGDIPLLGLPACGLHHTVTVLDLVLPRILAGERVDATALAMMGHGGLCRNCKVCQYPHCPFGKGA